MARPPRGREVLALAQQQLAKASEAIELRTLQAVVLPLAHGLSTRETAAMVGRSSRWVTTARNSYISSREISPKPLKKIRNNAHMSIEEETGFLAPFLEKARCGGVLVVNEIHMAGVNSPQTSATSQPTRKHKKTGKKTAGAACSNRKGMGRARAAQTDVPR